MKKTPIEDVQSAKHAQMPGWLIMPESALELIMKAQGMTPEQIEEAKEKARKEGRWTVMEESPDKDSRIVMLEGKA